MYPHDSASNVHPDNYSEIEHLTEPKNLSLIAEVFSTEPNEADAEKKGAGQSQISAANRYDAGFLKDRGQTAISKEQFLARNLGQSNNLTGSASKAGATEEKKKLSEVLKDQIQGLAIAERKRLEEERQKKEEEDRKSKEGEKMMFRSEVYPNAEFYSNDEVLRRAKEYNHNNPLFGQLKERIIQDVIQQTLKTEEEEQRNGTAENSRRNIEDPRTPFSPGQSINNNSQRYSNPREEPSYSQGGSQQDLISLRRSERGYQSSQLESQPPSQLRSQSQSQYNSNPQRNIQNSGRRPRPNEQAIDEEEEEYTENQGYSQGQYSQEAYSQSQYTYEDPDGYYEEDQSRRPTPPKNQQKGFQRSNPNAGQNKRK